MEVGVGGESTLIYNQQLRSRNVWAQNTLDNIPVMSTENRPFSQKRFVS